MKVKTFDANNPEVEVAIWLQAFSTAFAILACQQESVHQCEMDGNVAKSIGMRADAIADRAVDGFHDARREHR